MNEISLKGTVSDISTDYGLISIGNVVYIFDYLMKEQYKIFKLIFILVLRFVRHLDTQKSKMYIFK